MRCIKSFKEVYSWDENTNCTEFSITVVPIIRRTLWIKKFMNNHSFLGNGEDKHG